MRLYLGAALLYASPITSNGNIAIDMPAPKVLYIEALRVALPI